jgi:5'-3' exonuclease
VGRPRHNARMSEKTLLLVDGSSYLYRAYHACPTCASPDGFPTGAIHGIVAMMKWLRERFPAEHAACVFDAKGPTFRDDWYPEYKAQRSPMPDPLRQQIEPIHEVVRLLGWPVLEGARHRGRRCHRHLGARGGGQRPPGDRSPPATRTWRNSSRPR